MTSPQPGYREELTYARDEVLPYVRHVPDKVMVIHGYRYTNENAYFMSNGDIVPKVCPYCKGDVQRPEKYLDDHDACFPM